MKKGTATPHMNITPLVDVVLVLLVIFMVVTPLLSKTFALNVPKKDDAEPPPGTPQEQVVVRVMRDGKLFINQTEVPKAALSGQVARYMAARSDKVVYFDGEDDAPYASAVEAMDLARGGGAKTVAIMTEALPAP